MSRIEEAFKQVRATEKGAPVQHTEAWVGGFCTYKLKGACVFEATGNSRICQYNHPCSKQTLTAKRTT